jgi:hypothetical protein
MLKGLMLKELAFVMELKNELRELASMLEISNAKYIMKSMGGKSVISLPYCNKTIERGS